MTGNTKRKTLILLGLITLITMIIAANLPALEFQPGMPIPRLQNHGQVVTVPTEENQYVSISTSKFVLVFLALVFTAATLYTMHQLLRGTNWKIILDLLRPMLIMSLVISCLVFVIILDLLRPMLIMSLVISCLVFVIMLFSGSDSYTSAVEIPTSAPQPVVTSPLGSTPPALLWLVGIGLLVISAIVVMWIFTPLRRVNPIDLVGLEAEKARQALKTGMELKNVIIHCYVQMSLALKREQGIEREDFMTTGEFENLLETAGLPHEPIHQLTQLFDAVRYGNWKPNSVDEQKAIQCLEAIMLHSRSIRGMN